MKVMASAGIKEAYLELLPRFAARHAGAVETLWVPTVDMLDRLKGGEAVDLVVMMSTAIDELAALGCLDAASRVELVSSHVGAAVKAGAAHPDLSSAQRFTAAMLSAAAIGYSHGPSGMHVEALLRRLGIAERVRHKVRQVKGVPVGALVAAGEVEIGFQQVSELLPVPGIELLPALPAELDRVTLFAAAVHARAGDPARAAALARFLRSAEAAPVMRAKGLVPLA
jgi:molybdate transport system substrate-binding protein